MCRQGATREQVTERMQEAYGTQPEYLWRSYPEHAVLRHSNGKWYAIIMRVAREKLGIPGEGDVDLLAVKCDPGLQPVLLQQEGFVPAYHLNKEHWVGMLLDGSVDAEQAVALLDMSYAIVGASHARRSGGERR